MKFHVVMLGVLFCMPALAADKPSQGAATNKSVPAQQTLSGCVDEQYGQYVLLDAQMLKITSLQSAGSEREVFAKYLGHKVQVRGTNSSGPKPTFTVTAIEQIADKCGQAK